MGGTRRVGQFFAALTLSGCLSGGGTESPDTTPTPACPAGSARCQPWTGCIDFNNDPRNCGRCSHACPTNSLCREGSCARCPGTLSVCDGACVDLRADVRHCGICEWSCAERMSCVDGRCVGNEPPIVQRELRTPLTGFVTTSRRPWFRWAPPDARRPARVQVCTARNCERVEASWVMTAPAMRSPEPLPPGVHFWRVVPLEGPPTGDELVGEFAIPGAGLMAGEPFRDEDGDGTVDPPRGAPPRSTQQPIGDFTGDGYVDFANLATYGAKLRHAWEVYAGGPERERFATVFAAGDAGVYVQPRHEEAARAAGDRDGDGFSDLLCSVHSTDDWPNPRGYAYVSHNFVYTAFGGRPRRTLGVETTRPEVEVARPVALADLDADGATDLAAYEGRGDGAVALVSMGRASPEALPWMECPVPLAPSQPPTVADEDDDGFDDVLVGGRIVLRGGPWFSRGRCGPEAAP
ncbi:MAG: hypothetical protein U0324_21200 [Polyangiales bacterium]